jgi:hypothetical protein
VLNVDVYFAHVYDTVMIANKQTEPAADTLNAPDEESEMQPKMEKEGEASNNM